MISLDALIISDEDINALEKQENLVFDGDRRSILKSLKSIDVQACPGSGKTTLIAAKLILLAKKWTAKHQGICVLSHTNVAKDEIISRLRKSKSLDAQRLLSHPHFIGTIQEFVNKFLGIPLIKSWGIEIHSIDDKRCTDYLTSKLSFKTRSFLERRSRINLFDFNLKKILPLKDWPTEGSFFQFNIPDRFPKDPKGHSYIDLLKKREEILSKDGYFAYKDMYAFADHLLKDHSYLQKYVHKRFPILFLDEMQDTQKFQDTLIQSIFPTENSDLIVQRFGDPDQAIFNGINGEEGNESFNLKKAENMLVINKSHRYSTDISSKIKSFSFNNIPLETDLSDQDQHDRKKNHQSKSEFKHTIFVYETSHVGSVIPKFAELVSTEFCEDYQKSPNFTVKVIGAIGNEIDKDKDQLKIGHYWNGFDKSKSVKTYTEKSLLDAVYHCRSLGARDLNNCYKHLTECILKMLSKSGTKTNQNQFYNSSTLKTFLIEKGQWFSYRKLFFELLHPNTELNQLYWKKVKDRLGDIVGIELFSAESTLYLDFSNNTHLNYNLAISDDAGLAHQVGNVLYHKNLFKIELNTIHAVKGESHDATLVLSTKFYKTDIDSMLPFLIGDRPNDDLPNSILKPNPSTAKDGANQKFMRQLYVAMSRAKHLLCIAINKEHLTPEHRCKLQSKGWHITEVTSSSTNPQAPYQCPLF